MNFFSGFSLQNEAPLFKEYLIDNAYTVSGFSLGAIDAFDYTFHATHRIDRLQLFSPAFFEDKNDKFKRLQTLHYQKNRAAYEENFLQHAAYPSSIDLHPFYKEDNVASLEKLLYHVWEGKQLKTLNQKGIEIEVYLGGRDKIIDAQAAYDFFKPSATIYFIKEGGHILWTA